MRDFFAGQTGGGAWRKWPNGKYATDLKPLLLLAHLKSPCGTTKIWQGIIISSRENCNNNNSNNQIFIAPYASYRGAVGLFKLIFDCQYVTVASLGKV